MNRGLEGVVVAETVLSDADSEAGRLWMRGVPLADLVARYGYEGKRTTWIRRSSASFAPASG